MGGGGGGGGERRKSNPAPPSTIKHYNWLIVFNRCHGCLSHVINLNITVSCENSLRAWPDIVLVRILVPMIEW